MKTDAEKRGFRGGWRGQLGEEGKETSGAEQEGPQHPQRTGQCRVRACCVLGPVLGIEAWRLHKEAWFQSLVTRSLMLLKK